MNAAPLLTREQCRCVDRLAIDEYGIAGIVLMENAGRGVAEALLAEMGREGTAGSVAILCGKGNNAGDGFVVARHLEIHGVGAKVVLVFPASELAGDAETNYRILTRSSVPVVQLAAEADLASALDRHAGGAAWIVDALLGTGAVGEPRPPISEAIRWMNAQPGRRFAIDVPSGLDCDSGTAAATTVRADATCTLAAAKPGLLRAEAAAFVGRLSVASIGVPPVLLRRASEM